MQRIPEGILRRPATLPRTDLHLFTLPNLVGPNTIRRNRIPRRDHHTRQSNPRSLHSLPDPQLPNRQSPSSQRSPSINRKKRQRSSRINPLLVSIPSLRNSRFRECENPVLPPAPLASYSTRRSQSNHRTTTPGLSEPSQSSHSNLGRPRRAPMPSRSTALRRSRLPKRGDRDPRHQLPTAPPTRPSSARRLMAGCLRRCRR